MYPILAEITGNIASAFGLLGAAIGVGMIGTKAAESVGRNPGASGKILTNMMIGLAMIESLAIYALVVSLIILFANPFTKTVLDLVGTAGKVAGH